MKAVFSTIYRAEIQVPSDLYDRFGLTAGYAQKSAAIFSQSNVAAGGQDSYANVYEWAEDSSLACVERWAHEWEAYLKELACTPTSD